MMEDSASFLCALDKFHQGNGTPFNQLIKLNGKEVDLHMLYKIVTIAGGRRAVNRQDCWKIVYNILKSGPDSCVNGEVGIKHIYLRYLADYEDKFYKPINGHFHYDKKDFKVEVPMKYKHWHVSDYERNTYGLSKDIVLPSPYEKLSLSLISPLPNEQDFAINAIACMSIEINKFLIEDDPRVLKYLLAHAGIYNDDTLQNLFDKYYRVDRLHCLKTFWAQSFDHTKISPMHQNKLESYFGPVYVNKFSTDEFVLLRVEQVGKIILNISATKNNHTYMLLDECCIKYIIYCCHSKLESLVSIGWDLLTILTSNILPDIPDNEFIILHCMTTIQKNNPSRISYAFEVLTNFAKENVYSKTIIDYITPDVLHTIMKLLTINDIIVVMKILDFLLILSLNNKFCEILVENKSMDYLFVILMAEVDQLKSTWGELKYSTEMTDNNIDYVTYYYEYVTVLNTKSTEEHLKNCALLPIGGINDEIFNHDYTNLDETGRQKIGVYLCEWKSCMRQFKNQESLRVHCQEHSKSSKCLWWGCDKIDKYEVPLLSHLIKAHCTSKHWSSQTKSFIDHYNDYTALYDSNKNESGKTENPATKSIRITAALILRNVLLCYPLAINRIKNYEFSLVEIASSNNESSKIVAEILGLISSM